MRHATLISKIEISKIPIPPRYVIPNPDDQQPQVYTRGVKPTHRTQEEDFVSNFLLTEEYLAYEVARHPRRCDDIWRGCFDLRDSTGSAASSSSRPPKFWGMKVPKLTPEHIDVLLGNGSFDLSKERKAQLKSELWETWQLEKPHSYKMNNGEDPSIYSDAWVISGSHLSRKCQEKKLFIFEDHFPCDLVFVAGPNAVDSSGKTDLCPNRWASMYRTANPKTFSPDEESYQLFRQCVAATLRAGFLAMINVGANVAIVGGISTGVYAGVHKERINREFEDIVNEVLQQPLDLEKDEQGDQNMEGHAENEAPHQIGHYFLKVSYPILKKIESSPKTKRTTTNSSNSDANFPPNGSSFFSATSDHGYSTHGYSTHGGYTTDGPSHWIQYTQSAGSAFDSDVDWESSSVFGRKSSSLYLGHNHNPTGMGGAAAAGQHTTTSSSTRSPGSHKSPINNGILPIEIPPEARFEMESNQKPLAGAVRRLSVDAGTTTASTTNSPSLQVKGAGRDGEEMMPRR